MTNEKFTPGPWTVSDKVWRLGQDTYLDVQSPEHRHVSMVMEGTPEAEADARLIAAAPELYAALTALRDAVKASGMLNGRDYDQLGIQVNAALDKARGHT